jgi:hypothetical protein
MAKPNCPFLSIDHNFSRQPRIFRIFRRLRDISKKRSFKFNLLATRWRSKKYFAGAAIADASSS